MTPGFYWLQDTLANDSPNPFIAYNDSHNWYFPRADEPIADLIQGVPGNLITRYQVLRPIAPYAALTVNPATVPGGTNAVAYSQTLTGAGGTGLYSFTVASGTLPTGLALSTSGQLSGTPTAPGSSTFTVQANDANGNTGTRSYTLVIA
jgi:hypothetical protein